ncbi:hypothetical protein [Bacillus sp. P14.5]|uniref:hypothetical protein n=1 Tax=Bacillus sp. P14.5 TaxID=1983400 RepID=UPI0031F4A503
MLIQIKQGSHIETIKEVLVEEANAILEFSNTLDSEINNTVEMILACKGRLVVTGVGKSGIIGKK